MMPKCVAQVRADIGPLDLVHEGHGTGLGSEALPER
jgi:hypothetical protein